MKHPEWAKSSVIYELNTRQFTPEGTFRAAKNHLPRLKELGIEIIWMMPIYPIGVEERKGTLGSYYSVKNYTDINPEFGTMADFKDFVSTAKSLGLRVIIDWVANHTSRDAVWVSQHPSWYKWDPYGKIVAPYDWSDVAQLDTHNHEMWMGMAEAMIYWLKETDIDGFRCDMASLLPVDFWKFIRIELENIRPVFMLAESEDPFLHHYAFNATYCWELHHIINDIAQGKTSVETIEKYFKRQQDIFSKNDMRMAFTSNHDENSWTGTEFERMGLAAKQMAAFTFIIPSIPLIYNGQEAALSHKLSFFEKDKIEWNVNLDFAEHYKKLCQLKKEFPQLWNSSWGGEMSIKTDSRNNTAIIERILNGRSVVGIFNFSHNFTSVTVPPNVSTDYMTKALLLPGSSVKIGPWQYFILTK